MDHWSEGPCLESIFLPLPFCYVYVHMYIIMYLVSKPINSLPKTFSSYSELPLVSHFCLHDRSSIYCPMLKAPSLQSRSVLGYNLDWLHGLSVCQYKVPAMRMFLHQYKNFTSKIFEVDQLGVLTTMLFCHNDTPMLYTQSSLICIYLQNCFMKFQSSQEIRMVYSTTHVFLLTIEEKSSRNSSVNKSRYIKFWCVWSFPLSTLLMYSDSKTYIIELYPYVTSRNYHILHYHNAWEAY